MPASTSCMTARAVSDLVVEANRKGGLGGDRPAGRAGLAEAAQVHDPVAVDDAKGQAGQAGGAPLRLHIAVDGGKIRRAGARCAGRGRDRWAHRAKCEQGEQGSQHRDGGPPHCAGPQPPDRDAAAGDAGVHGVLLAVALSSTASVVAMGLVASTIGTGVGRAGAPAIQNRANMTAQTATSSSSF